MPEKTAAERLRDAIALELADGDAGVLDQEDEWWTTPLALAESLLPALMADPDLLRELTNDAWLMKRFPDIYRRRDIENHLRLGCCVDCMVDLRPTLTEAVADVRAQLPAELHTPDRPTFRRWGRRRCPDCGWEGHEGEMRLLRTLLGDGQYPGGCPSCSFESAFLGRHFESLDGFDVVEVVS